MGLTTLARLGIGSQQKQNGMMNSKVGVLPQALVLLHLPLNCPWRASAAAAMVRSSMSVPSASIGVLQLAARMLAASSSVAAMPAWSPTSEQSESLYVALRIDTLISEAI